MQHSKKEQARTYDCRTSSDKVAHAIQLSSKEAAFALGDRVYDVELLTSGENMKKKLPLVWAILSSLLMRDPPESNP